MDYLQIEKVIGREIIDSRGNPTVEAEVHSSFATATRANTAEKAFPRPSPTSTS